MANPYPFWQHYPRDFEADPKVEAMSTLAFGAYVKLLHRSWDQAPVGTIPNDDQTLARWAKMDLEAWLGVRDQVLLAWKLGKDRKRYHQKRQKREFERLLKATQSKSDAGKRGANKAWQNRRLRNGSAIAQQAQPHSYSSTSASAEGIGNSTRPCAPATGPPATVDRRDIIAAMERWSKVARKGEGLHAERNEHTPIFAMFDTVSLEFFRHGEGQLDGATAMLLAIGNVAKKGQHWGNGRGRIQYAMSVLESTLEQWRVGGVPVQQNGGAEEGAWVTESTITDEDLEMARRAGQGGSV